jgi:hypothetical protein
MTKRTPHIWFALLILLILQPFPLFSAETDSSNSSTSDQPLQVLFIGNSYTYYNDLPGMVTAMSAQLPAQRAIETSRYAVGMASLRRLWSSGGALARIRSQPWDVVVLQDGSSSPSRNLQQFSENIIKFDPFIRAQGAYTLLFMTWAHEFRPDMNEDNLAAFEEVRETRNIPFAPVGIAWQLALDAEQTLPLYDANGTHPAPMGTYLAACVFLQTLLQSTITCPAVDGVSLTGAQRDILHQAASEALSLQVNGLNGE